MNSISTDKLLHCIISTSFKHYYFGGITLTITIDFIEPKKIGVTSRIAINNNSNGNKREPRRD